MKTYSTVSTLLTAMALASCGPLPEKKRVTSVNEDANFQLVVLGDSVASGMFADTTLGDELSWEGAKNFAEIYRVSEKYPADSEDFYLRAQEIAAEPAATAFAGTAEYSFKTRLASHFGDIGLRSYAISGATISTLASQTQELAGAKAAGLKPASIVILHIGANDFCDKTPLDDFRAAWRTRVEEILAAEPDAKIMVTAVPDVPKILALPDQKAVHALGIDATCADVRERLQLCAERADLTADAAPAVKAAAAKELAVMNAALEAELSAVRRAHGNTDRIALAKYGLDHLQPSMMAIDCFHPSADGQRNIADATWPTAAALLGIE